MTSAEIAARRDRWFLAIGYGLLAEFATILTIVLVITLYQYAFFRGGSPADYAHVGEIVGMVVGVFGGALYTFSFARQLMRKISSHFIAHGVVVALAAIALSVAGSIAGHQSVPASYIWASILKIIAGAAAGVIYQRYMAATPAGNTQP